MIRARLSVILPGLALLTAPAFAGGSTGDSVNSLIDNLLATGNRLLELPLYMLLIIAAVISLIIAMALNRLLKRRESLRRSAMVAMGVAFLICAAVVVDRRLALMQGQINQLRSKQSSDAIARLDAVPPQHAGRKSLLFDAAAVQKSLPADFEDITLKPAIYNEAIDVVQIHIRSPLAQAYLAVIDLTNPDVEIRLGTNLDEKTLTSDFARDSGCTLAINGEAGSSPFPNSGLGNWGGNFAYHGKILLREDDNYPRPYLAFDQKNHATFTAAASPSAGLAADAYNVIWGRLDLITNGVVQTADARNHQPRTAMAINADGTRLFLLVVDGRQPRYSMGFTRAEVGTLLKAFGAHDGMLCDEGGSSCIYLRDFGGISNIPSDNQGEERPTYTHFGIAMKGEMERATTEPSARQ